MIKICPGCKSTWAGGMFCEDCGKILSNPYGEEAKQFSEGVWSYIRLQYGARRGMIVRVLAYLLGPVVSFALLRESVVLPMPWIVVAVTGSIVAGLLTWWTIHFAAGKAVRIWVLRKGQLNKRRLAKAMLKRALPGQTRKGG